ncbi:MAG: hypothetical protein OXC30_03320 [Alphaproteobacteria bacterium]|nr:hypothetical protein [Alphaproteobacteria bacterium]
MLLLLLISCLHVYGATVEHCFDSSEDGEKKDQKAFVLDISTLLPFMQLCQSRFALTDMPPLARSEPVDKLICLVRSVKYVLEEACKERDPHFSKISPQKAVRRSLIIKKAKNGIFKLNPETYLASFCQLEIDYEEDLCCQRGDERTFQDWLKNKEAHPECEENIKYLENKINIPSERATLEDKNLHSFNCLLQSLYSYCTDSLPSARASFASCWKQPLVIGESMAPRGITFTYWKNCRFVPMFLTFLKKKPNLKKVRLMSSESATWV